MLSSLVGSEPHRKEGGLPPSARLGRAPVSNIILFPRKPCLGHSPSNLQTIS